MEEQNMQDAPQPYSEAEYKHHVKDVYKTTIILSIVTIVEVAFALFYEFVLIENYGAPRMPLMLFVIAASLVKAYWIMAVFMHMKHENKGFTLSLLVPTGFLIWGIIAFLLEGSNWGVLRGGWLDSF